MKHVSILVIASIVSGCATSYVGPTEGPIAKATFQLEEGLVDGPTVSMFEGVECEPSEFGENIGTLWDGNWTEPSTLNFTVNIPADRVLAFEFFHRTSFTGEMVQEGQFCRHTFAFTPQPGEHYIFTYGACEYQAIVESTEQPLETMPTTGRCHSADYVGAY